MRYMHTSNDPSNVDRNHSPLMDLRDRVQDKYYMKDLLLSSLGKGKLAKQKDEVGLTHPFEWNANNKLKYEVRHNVLIAAGNQIS